MGETSEPKHNRAAHQSGPPCDVHQVKLSPEGESLSPRSSELDLALEEEGDDQSVDAQRLDKSQADDHRGLDLARSAWVTSNALQRAKSGEALTDTAT